MMTYGCATWSYASTTHTKRLQVIQNKVLPMAVRNSQIHRDVEVLTTEELIREAEAKALQ